ncbi:MAG: XRE family transcriptional regulator [Prevotellaceae bacterium]|jgi:transcriptional regulator with XRE-family HTH domain|nr:XRE family transcriptional regulator [Prevotellaceae bacterium]
MKKGIVIGNKIKAIREAQNMTAEQLAKQSGLSLEQITTLEDTETLTALSPLIRVARALGVRLGTFLDDDSALGPVVCRRNEAEASISFSNDKTGGNRHMNYFSLAKTKSGRHIEPFIISIAACTKKDFIMSSHEGEEFIYVLEGVIKITYGKEVFILEAGDSIFYDSIVEHLVEGSCESAAKILAVVYSPM